MGAAPSILVAGSVDYAPGGDCPHIHTPYDYDYTFIY